MTVHGGKKLGVIKPIATGIEVDIDGLGRGEGSVSSTGLNDVQPPWLRDQPPDEPEQMTMTDLSELNPLTKYQDIPNHLNLFSHNPQGSYVRVYPLFYTHVSTERLEST